MTTAALFTPSDRSLGASVSSPAFSNPFETGGQEPSWFAPPPAGADDVTRLTARARERIEDGASPDDADARLYAELVAADVLRRNGPRLAPAVASRPLDAPPLGDLWRDADAALRPLARPDVLAPQRLVAHVVQVVRAHHHVALAVPGRSDIASRLRAATWRSIFTHDMRRHLRAPQLAARVATLVVGPSRRTARRLAEAVGRSAHVEFDERTLGLRAAGAPPLGVVEAASTDHAASELFGADDRHAGRLELPGTIFVTDVAALDASLQARLRAALEARTVRRPGETRTRPVAARLVASTPRDPAADVSAGRLDPGLHELLAANRLVVPPLAERLAADADELEDAVRDAAGRLVDHGEVDELTAEAVAAIRRDAPDDHPWPGDEAELDRCVQSVLVRGLVETQTHDAGDLARWLADVERGALTAEALLAGYCSIVYARVGSLQGAARTLDIDRRTVKAKLDPKMLARIRDR